MGGADGRGETEDELPPTRTAAPVQAAVGTPKAKPNTTIVTAADALGEEERVRTRLLGLCGLVVNVLGALALPIFGGTPWSRRAFIVGLLLHAASNVGLFYFAGRPERYREGALIVVWPLSFVALQLVMAFFGLLSVAAVAQILGIYIVGVSRYARVALVSLSVAAVGTAISVILLLLGLLPDDGIVSLSGLAPREVVAMLALLESTYLVAFIISRQARRRLSIAVEQLRAATQAVAQRDAVLEEARANFRRVAVAGDPGRFTGAQLGGFVLENLLGRGGMGEIYEGRADDVEAAVKVLKSEATHDADALSRFFRESLVLASIDSAHVVEVLEVGGPPEEVPFIAMERLRGLDLGTHLEERIRIPVAEVARVVREAGAGLRAAAEAGVTHRDVKPQNIFRLEPEVHGVRYKVLDFGISSLSHGPGTLTQGNVVGTPGYLAPEQASGEAVDLRTDLYGLAAVAYRCLVGRAPFRGAKTADILAVLRTMPVAPSRAAPLGPALDLVFAIALAKRPEDRFGSAEELAAALLEADAGRVSPELEARARPLIARWPWS